MGDDVSVTNEQIESLTAPSLERIGLALQRTAAFIFYVRQSPKGSEIGSEGEDSIVLAARVKELQSLVDSTNRMNDELLADVASRDEDIKGIEANLEHWISKAHDAKASLNISDNECNRLERVETELREALDTHGTHAAMCKDNTLRYGPDAHCDCGLEKAMEFDGRIHR